MSGLTEEQRQELLRRIREHGDALEDGDPELFDTSARWMEMTLREKGLRKMMRRAYRLP